MSAANSQIPHCSLPDFFFFFYPQCNLTADSCHSALSPGGCSRRRESRRRRRPMMSSRLGGATQGSRRLLLPVDAGRLLFFFFSICFFLGCFFPAVLNHFHSERVTYQTVCRVPCGGTGSVTQRASQTRLQPESPRGCAAHFDVQGKGKKKTTRNNNNKHRSRSFLERATEGVFRRYRATTSVGYC